MNDAVEKKVEYLVRVARSEFVSVELIAGELTIDGEFVCPETNVRYQILGIALGGSPAAHEKGIHVLHLATIDGSMEGHPLSRGMHLVRRHAGRVLGT